MSTNLIAMVKDLLDGPLMDQLSGLLGEGDEATKKAVNAGLPAILGGLIKKASQPSGASDITQELENHDGEFVDSLGGILSGDTSEVESTGNELLGKLFGPGLVGVIAWLSKTANIRSDAAKQLLSLLAPVVMSVLAMQKQKQGLDAGGVNQLLTSQQDAVAAALPEGLGSILGQALGGDAAEKTSVPEHHPDLNQKGGGVMKFLLPLFLIAAIIFFLMKSFDGADVQREAVTDDLDVPEIEIPSVDIPDLETPANDGNSDTEQNPIP